MTKFFYIFCWTYKTYLYYFLTFFRRKNLNGSQTYKCLFYLCILYALLYIYKTYCLHCQTVKVPTILLGQEGFQSAKVTASCNNFCVIDVNSGRHRIWWSYSYFYLSAHGFRRWCVIDCTHDIFHLVFTATVTYIPTLHWGLWTSCNNHEIMKYIHNAIIKSGHRLPYSSYIILYVPAHTRVLSMMTCRDPAAVFCCIY